MKTCVNCKFAEWQMTNHATPRINKNYPGRCNYIVPLKTLSIPAAVRKNDISYIINPSAGHAVWADRPYKDCPVWEEKDD